VESCREKEVGGEKLVQDSAPRANRANITTNTSTQTQLSATT
jgi:hypothetical protein